MYVKQERLEKLFTANPPFEFESDNLPGKYPILNEADRKVVRFYSRYRLWVFDYAETLALGTKLNTLEFAAKDFIIGNSGFAVLTLLNPYFDALGLLCGEDNDDTIRKYETKGRSSWKSWDDWENDPKVYISPKQRIWYGLHTVFRDHLVENNIDPKADDSWYQTCNHLYEQTRNGIAHIGFPGGTMVFVPQPTDTDLEFKQPLVWGDYKGKFTVFINWRAWYKHLRNHFEAYVLRLRNAHFSSVDHPDYQMRERFLRRIDRLR